MNLHKPANILEFLVYVIVLLALLYILYKIALAFAG